MKKSADLKLEEVLPGSFPEERANIVIIADIRAITQEAWQAVFAKIPPDHFQERVFPDPLEPDSYVAGRFIEVYGPKKKPWIIAVNELRFTEAALYEYEDKTTQKVPASFEVSSILYFNESRDPNFLFIPQRLLASGFVWDKKNPLGAYRKKLSPGRTLFATTPKNPRMSEGSYAVIETDKKRQKITYPCSTPAEAMAKSDEIRQSLVRHHGALTALALDIQDGISLSTEVPSSPLKGGFLGFIKRDESVTAKFYQSIERKTS